MKAAKEKGGSGKSPKAQSRFFSKPVDVKKVVQGAL